MSPKRVRAALRDSLGRTILAAALSLWFLADLGAGTSLAEGELARANKHRQAFLADPERQKTRSSWLELITEYENAALAQVEPRFAGRARAWGADLALTVGRKFKQAADFEKADQLARRAVLDCPRCSYAAESLFISGQALLELKQLDSAVKQLLKVELNYPDSPLVEQTERLLAQIRGRPAPAPRAPPAAKAAPPVKPTPAPKAAAEAPKPPQIPPPPRSRADGLAQVYFLHLADHGDHTTVTAYLDKTTAYLYNLIPAAGGSFRAYADLKNTVVAPGARLQLKEKSPLVSLVKMNQYQRDVTRLVLDLPQAHPYRPTFLDQPPRLVFQVAREAGTLKDPPPEAAPAPLSVPSSRPSAPSVRAGGVKGPADSLARQLGLKVKTVVIDPGHGGKDTGASGFGLREKDITLKLAHKLADRLSRRLGLTVFLTRSDDRFLTLSRRAKIAQEKKADLFISLHVNASDLASVEGLETYILNFATDRSAMAVAARENASADKTISELQDILQTLAKNTKIAESRTLAQTLHKAAITALAKDYKIRDLGVKEAPFFVLIGTASPSLLMEIGFISNEKEAGRLNSGAYLDRLADGLTDGLAAYLKGL